MQLSIQSSPLYSNLLGDPELADLLNASSEVRALIDVEAALASAQSAVGMIPETVGADMTAALQQVVPDMASLSQGISDSGVVVPVLLVELQKHLPQELAQWLHWGATSQDIIDTATMLQVSHCVDLLENRLSQLLNALYSQSQTHASTLMAARTRTQLATPITLGLRIAQWAQPLIGLENELPALQAKVLKLQLGGAVGANTVMTPQAAEVAAHMANALQLSCVPSWHTDRSSIISLANWLLQICLHTGKLAKDLMIMSRSDIAEVKAGQTGGSSTMPHKANPVKSEMVVAMNTIAQALHAGICAAASPAEERDGASWTVEWVLLPQLIVTTGCALRHSVELIESVIAEKQRLQSSIDKNPQIMSEAASFALAQHMPRSEAQVLVKQALASKRPMHLALQEQSNFPVDWASVLDPRSVCTPCQQVSASIFALRAKT